MNIETVMRTKAANPALTIEGYATAYRTRLPEWASWRHSLRLPVAEGPGFVLTEALKQYAPYCVKDLWALMTREAATWGCYWCLLVPTWRPSGCRADHTGRGNPNTNYIGFPECRWGAPLLREGARVDGATQTPHRAALARRDPTTKLDGEAPRNETARHPTRTPCSSSLRRRGSA